MPTEAPKHPCPSAGAAGADRRNGAGIQGHRGMAGHTPLPRDTTGPEEVGVAANTAPDWTLARKPAKGGTGEGLRMSPTGLSRAGTGWRSAVGAPAQTRKPAAPPEPLPTGKPQEASPHEDGAAPHKAGDTKSDLQSAQARTRSELTAARQEAPRRGRSGGAGLAQPRATKVAPERRGGLGFARLAGG
jgi:hypothetical protein